MTQMHVNSAALNIRSSAGMTFDNIVATLPFGHPLETVGEHDSKRWIRVEATVQGRQHTGFVNVGYLRAPLSAAKEQLLASAAAAWTAKDKSYAPPGSTGFEQQFAGTAKPATGDVIRADSDDLVVARGLTQVWALTPDLKIVRYPLLEDGRLDDKAGKVKAVLRNLG